jgi:hypothetical protein
MIDAQRAKRDLRAFLKRLYRREGDFPVIWKLEPQRRGAWHFHLIVFYLPYVPLKTILHHWREVTSEATITEVRIEPISSAKKCRSYVAKYVGKRVEDRFIEWFALLLLKAPNWFLFLSYLDYLPNLAATIFPGRYWGIENRKNMPWATLVEMSIVLNEVFYNLKRAARRHWRGTNTNARCGFTLYVRNAGQWLDYMFYLIGENHKERVQCQC